MSQRKEKANQQRTLAILHELAGHIVDRGNDCSMHYKEQIGLLLFFAKCKKYGADRPCMGAAD